MSLVPFISTPSRIEATGNKLNAANFAEVVSIIMLPGFRVASVFHRPLK